jgi:nicotinamidase/pyrazinamidase
MDKGAPKHSVLLVIDVQNDFCTGGALAVPGGEEVVPLVNALAVKFPSVVLTQDWHTPGHSSFASAHPDTSPFDTTEMPYGTQVLWPDHCVQGTHSAAFHNDLDTGPAELIIRKGFRPGIDSYSAFQENDRLTTTGLAGFLREREIQHVYLCGLAFDFCVKWSALDAAKLGFTATVVPDACRAIDLNGSKAQAEFEMSAAGVRQIAASDLLPS